MKFHDLEQGSPEWHEFRKCHIGASDAVQIYKGYGEKLLAQKLSGKKTFTTPAMQRGHDLEPIARNRFNEQRGLGMEPAVVTHDVLEWASASLDGLSADRKSLLEVKCCKDEIHEQTKWGIIEPDHMFQMQWQLFVTDVDLGYYNHFNGTEEEVVEVKRDEALITELVKACGAFWTKLKEALNSPTDEETECLAILVDHPDGDFLIERWGELSAQCKSISEEKEQLKEKILGIGPNQNFVVSGVLVYKKQGRVTYDTAAMLRDGINLEKYKKVGEPSWTISSSSKS